MKVVKVYGALRKFLGGRCRFEFEVDTPAQAIKALCVNFPDLEQWLIKSDWGYRVTVGKERIGPENAELVCLPWSEREVFSIAPVIAGAGQGVGQVFAGIGLVLAAIVLGPAAGGFLGLGAGLAGAGAGIIGGAAATAIGGLGAALLLGGVAQMISPQPNISPLVRGKEAARLESFSFSGINNTSQQGLPVPIAYGRVFAGSAVLSAGLDVDQLR
jgi:predicted phage tail protein